MSRSMKVSSSRPSMHTSSALPMDSRIRRCRQGSSGMSMVHSAASTGCTMRRTQTNVAMGYHGLGLVCPSASVLCKWPPREVLIHRARTEYAAFYMRNRSSTVESHAGAQDSLRIHITQIWPNMLTVEG